MRRSVSPPPSSIIKPAANPPGSAPERLQRSKQTAGPAAPDVAPTHSTLASSSSTESLVNHPDHYLKRPCGYEIIVSGEVVEPILYQPTPKGLQVLIDDFTQRTGLRFGLLDQSSDDNRSVVTRFQAAKPYIDAVFPEDDKPTAVILSCGQMHALPVLLVRQEGIKQLIILDATSGPIEPIYRDVANAFPNHRILLNCGTRQADTQSCITDAFEILSKALQIDGIGAKISARIVRRDDGETAAQSAAAGGARPRFFQKRKARHDNFHVFRMPEELCFTAQRTDFVKNSARADLSKSFQLAGEKTTLERERIKNREFSRHAVPPTAGVGTSASYRSINHYLYDASRRHKQIIDSVLERQEAQTVGSSSAFPFASGMAAPR